MRSTSSHPHMVEALGPQPLHEIRPVGVERSALWLERGFNDFMAHPAIALAYGGTFALLGWFLTFGLASIGMDSLILPLASGFMLVAPLAAVGLYEVSRRRERGEDTSFAQAIAAVAHNRQIADMGLVLMMLFLVWFMLAMVIFALFFSGSPPSLTEFIPQVLGAPQGAAFLITGTLVGAVVATVAFTISVVSIPMLLDRDVAVLTAMRVSVRAVWLNRRNMIGWAATLAALGLLGIAFFFVGLAFTLPVAAHASWHAYRDLVVK